MGNKQDETAVSSSDHASPISGTSPQPLMISSPEETTDRKALIERAKQFLHNDTISQAPVAEKETFLKEKGLEADEIQALLESDEIDSSRDEQVAKAAPSTEASSTDSEDMASLSSSSAPPIITYPEWLRKPPKPPLFSPSTITSAVYLLGAVATLTAGANKYLIQPLFESLTDARHDLNRTTLNNLEKLNAQLENLVRQMPHRNRATLFSNYQTRQIRSDASSVISDPTELFHRDVGIQTTPTPQNTPHLSGSSSPFPATSESVLDSQIAKLNKIREMLDEISELLKPTPAQLALQDEVASLKQTMAALSQLSAPKSQQSGASIVQTLPGNSSEDPAVTRLRAHMQREEEQVAFFKAEIRALKGIVLGQRKIPAPPPVLGLGVENVEERKGEDETDKNEKADEQETGEQTAEKERLDEEKSIEEEKKNVEEKKTEQG